MSTSPHTASSKEWTAYYDRFPYFSHDKIRPGCHPVAMEHTLPPKRAIDLVHGLTDSPYFLSAIADHFYAKPRVQRLHAASSGERLLLNHSPRR